MVSSMIASGWRLLYKYYLAINSIEEACFPRGPPPPVWVAGDGGDPEELLQLPVAEKDETEDATRRNSGNHRYSMINLVVVHDW